MTRFAPAALAAAACLAATGAAAETGESWIFGETVAPLEGVIVAERPGFSTSPLALPVGRFQVEAGLDYVHDDTGFGDFDAVTLPLALLRVGLLENVEFRLGWAGVTAFDAGGEGGDVLANPTLGFKWQISAGGPGRPALGLLADVSLPVGEDSLSDNVDITAGLAWSYALGGSAGLFGTATAGNPSRGDDHFFRFTNALGVGFDLGRGWGTFVEWFATVEEDGADTHTLDSGLTYLVGDNLQLDVTGGVGLDNNAADVFVGFGVAYRW